MTWLADGNVLVALLLETHIHHERAHRWLSELEEDRFATCPATQGTLLRVHMRLSTEGSAAAAWKALGAVSRHPAHEWWNDSLDYLDVPVVHALPARCWETQMRLGVRRPIPGYGRLLAEMPDPA